MVEVASRAGDAPDLLRYARPIAFGSPTAA